MSLLSWLAVVASAGAAPVPTALSFVSPKSRFAVEGLPAGMAYRSGLGDYRPPVTLRMRCEVGGLYNPFTDCEEYAELFRRHVLATREPIYFHQLSLPWDMAQIPQPLLWWLSRSHTRDVHLALEFHGTRENVDLSRKACPVPLRSLGVSLGRGGTLDIGESLEALREVRCLFVRCRTHRGSVCNADLLAHLSRLELIAVDDAVQKGGVGWLGDCRHLCSIRVHCFNTADELLFAPKLPFLCSLTLDHCVSVDGLMALRHCVHLDSLTLERSLSALSIPCDTLRRLRFLRLEQCPLLLNLDVGVCASLAEFTVCECENLSTLTGLSALLSLRVLHLHLCGKLVLELDAASLSFVEALSVKECGAGVSVIGLGGDQSEEDSRHSGRPTPSLDCSQHLRELSLRGVRGCVVADLTNFAALSELCLWQCEGLVTLLLCGTTALKKLSICRCDALRSVLLDCTTPLTDLSLQGDDNTLRAILSSTAPTSSLAVGKLIGCKNLLRLELTTVYSTLLSVDLSGLTDLRELRIDGFVHMTRIVALSGKPALRKVRLWRCNAVRELDFLGCSELESVQLAHCSAIRMLHGLHECPKLRHVHFFNSSYISFTPPLALGSVRDTAVPCWSDVFASSRDTTWRWDSVLYLVTTPYPLLSQLQSVVLEGLQSLLSLDLGAVEVLAELRIHGCRNLEAVRGLEGKAYLRTVSLTDCNSLLEVTLTSCANLRICVVRACGHVKAIVGLSNLPLLALVALSCNWSLCHVDCLATVDVSVRACPCLVQAAESPFFFII